MAGVNTPGDVFRQRSRVTPGQRERLNGHRGAIVWFTGLSGAGKSTLAYAVEACLHEAGCRAFVLDGDNVRHGLCADLGFSDQDRSENIRRSGQVAALFAEAGLIVLAAFISPFRDDRQRVRALVPDGDFLEVYCRCPLAVCEARDTKGLYRRARAGQVAQFTGIGSAYDEPANAELVVDTGAATVEQTVERVLDMLRVHGVLPASPVQAPAAGC